MKEIVTGLTAQDIAALNQALDVIESKVDKLNLTREERRLLPSMGPRRLSFSKRAFIYAQQYPNLLPAVHDLAQFRQVDSDHNKLVDTARRFQPHLQSVGDTTMVIGALFNRIGRMFYKNALLCKEEGIAGITTVVEDLGIHFEGMGKRTIEDTLTEGGDAESTS